jgi:DNA-directed RNA polymerase subunit RPC12/RpoP
MKQKAVVCPKCGNKLQARKLLRLTNLNTITCQVCSSKLRVKNKNFNSTIGGVGGGIGGGLGTLLLISWIRTGNILFIGLFIALIIAISLSVWLLANKYIELELAETTNITQ